MDKTVKLPGESTINYCMDQKGFRHFIEKTKLDKQMAGREVYPVGVVLAVANALEDYGDYMQQTPLIARLMQARQSEIVECLIGHDRNAVEALKKMNLL